ncbi:hypothetical protein Pyn_18546 [Prunus yedoensis var. nudiflora]|uniref:WAT1-related protein n=1 Tax=Prunus yedoensis var. nudiflora TaxID=2094558 RepID=A0A314Y6Y4_PRUYE|nr:hypothetical protein Pyn_18546 [Prunus yedoensis var. nudiflora]
MEGNCGRQLSDYLANMLYLHLVSQTSSPLMEQNKIYFQSIQMRYKLIALLVLQLCFAGITAANQGFFFLGLYYVSPTFASAITFLMALALRLEHTNITRKDGLAKVMGTIASVGGATIITLYKSLPLLNQTEPIQGRTPLTEEMSSSTDMQNWKWGCIYLLGHCLAWATWMVFQAPMLKKYPVKLTLTSFTCFFGLIQFLVITAFVETEFENWKIQSGEELFTILYAPLQTLDAVKATLVLGDQLYSGGIIGALLNMLGLYSVLWGKNEENRVVNHREVLKKPLLEADIKEDYGIALYRHRLIGTLMLRT